MYIRGVRHLTQFKECLTGNRFGRPLLIRRNRRIGGARRFMRFLRETHFVSCRATDVTQSRLAAFRQWPLAQAMEQA